MTLIERCSPYVTTGKCVYIFSVPNGHFKVGIARDPEQRRADLQVGCPELITFVGATLIGEYGHDPAAVERRVHELLALYKTSGEWFLVSERTLMDAWALALRRPADLD
jgi:hypothetical protein